MMSDQMNIFNLYVESAAAAEEPSMIIDHYGNKSWWIKFNKLHREDGPAVEYADGDKAWCLHGKHYDDVNAWAKDVLKMHHKPHAADDVQRFLRAILTKEDLI